MTGHTTSKTGYSVVVTLKVESNDGHQAVACCSLCGMSKSLLGFYSQHVHTNDQLTERSLFSCKHTTAVIQRRLAKYDFDCSIRNDPQASKNVASTMQLYTSGSLKDGWITGPETLHSKGRLGIFISVEYEIFLFAIQKQSDSSTYRYHCFRCSKHSCHHSSHIAAPDSEIPEHIKPIRLQTRPLDNIISKDKYPCIPCY